MNWTRVIRRALAVLAILTAIVIFAALIILRTPQFHRYVLTKIMEQGQASTGGRLVVQDWNFRLRPLTVTLYGIALHGSEAPNQKPLLQIDRLTVGVRAQALLHRNLQLRELLIQHPVANVFVNEEGKNNLPTPPPKQTSSTTTIWNLAIGHVLLNHGEIYYNDKKTPLDADLHDLRTEVVFDPVETRYSGMLSYTDGRLQYASYSPLPHDLRAQFSATPQGASLNPVVLTVGSSRIAVRADLANYHNPTVNATYDVLIHTQDFESLSPAATPSGDALLTGKLHFANQPNQAAIRAMSVDGNIQSLELQVTSREGRLAIRKLDGDYHLADGKLRAHTVAGELLNGQVTTDVTITNIDTSAASNIHTVLRHISLEAARQAVRRSDVRKLPVTGALDGTVDASWAGSLKHLRMISDFDLRAAIWNRSTKPPQGTPVNAVAHVNYDAARNVIFFRRTTLRLPSTSVVIDGEVSNHSNLNVVASAGDLHQLEGLAAAFRQASSDTVQRPVLSGSARLNAVVQGTIERPSVSGQLNAQNLAVEGSQWSSAEVTFAANPSLFAVQNGSLTNARRGNVHFSAQVGLKDWSYSAASQITANVSSRNMSIEDLEHLADEHYPVTGTLSADLVFQGSQLNPTGHGSIQIAKASAYNEAIQNLGVQFQTEGDSITSKLNVSLPAGTAAASFAYTPQTKAYELSLTIPGIALQKLKTVQTRNIPVTGVFAASASGKGTLDNPQLTASFEIPQLQTRQTAISGIKAQVNVADERANFSLASDVSQAHVEARGTLNLTGDYYTEANIDTSRVPLGPLLALYATPPPGFQGATELHATLKGPLKDQSRIQAHLVIPTLTASYQAMQLGNANPIRADYANSTLTLQSADIRGTDTSLNIEGRIPIGGSAAMNVHAHGSIDLKLLSMFSSDVKSAGTVGLSVDGSGTLQHPEVRGQVQIKDVALSTNDLPIALDKFNGDLDVTTDRLQIRNLTGRMGGGEISAGGSIVYRPNMQFNVALQGKSIRLLYPDGVRTLLDSNLTFTGTTGASNLAGRVLIDSLTFTPDFDLSTFASQFNGTGVPPSGTSFADNVKLAVGVQSKQNLSARSSQVNLEGAVNLQVIGTASNPVVVGRTDLTSGELFFLNNRYALQRGIITFDNPNQTNPVLNVQVTTTVQQYNLTITLNGPVDKLTTTYTSDPPLATADVISLLYQGQTTEQAAAQGTSTDSFIAGQAASQVSGGIQKLAGISSLQIDPLIGGNNTNPTARIALQQRVTKNFLFTFSTDVSEPGAEQVAGEYQITPRWSVMVTRDQLGGVAVDGRLHTKF
jgi:translocation and assembly module TamB